MKYPAIRQKVDSFSQKMWTYKGVDVFPSDRNSSGIRWYARNGSGITLKADTKSSMRELIRDSIRND